MSRYHPVRPKKQQKHHQAAPEPATQAHSERLEEVAARFYGYMGGDEVDASIARWKKLLAVHDREVAKLAEGEIEGGYRWTVSPAMAFRIDKYLHALLTQRAQIKMRSFDEARAWLARQGEGDSLCPPKQTPAPHAGFQADETATSNPSNQEGESPPLKPAV